MSKSVERWLPSAVALGAGAALLAGSWLGGHPVSGLVAFAIMAAVAAGVVVAARLSETVKGLLDRRDERIVSIDLRATAASGVLTIIAILAGAVVELARGHSGAPFTWLGAVAGLSYLAVVVVLRLRG
jgi:hypothetical protein